MSEIKQQNKIPRLPDKTLFQPTRLVQPTLLATWLISVLCYLLLIFSPIQAYSAEAGAHAYNNLPIDLNIVQVLYFQSESSGKLSRLTTQAGVLRYYRTFPLFGQVALIGGFLPYARAKLDVPSFALHKQVTGISDPTLVIGMDFFGAPALTREQFKHYKAGTVFGGSLQITAPLGSYDPASRLNLSGNRWVFKPELALTQTVDNWELELLGHYHHFTSNKFFLSKLTREQRGRWGMDAHLSYTIMRGMWLSVDYLRRWGGETSINGVRQGDPVRDSTLGFTAEMAFSPAIALQLTYRNDIVTQSLNKTNSFTLKSQYFW